MNKIKILPVLLGLALVSCAKTPDSVISDTKANEKGNAQDTNAEETTYVCAADVWSDIDAAYKANYTKFVLPDRETLSCTVPDEISAFELEYVNKESDESWYTEHLRAMEENTGVLLSGEGEYDCGIITHDDGEIRYKIRHYSAPYCHFQYQSALDFNEAVDFNYFDLLQKTNEYTDSSVNAAADFDGKIYSALESELDTQPYEAYTFTLDNRQFSEVLLQKTYKNMGIQALSANSPTGDYWQTGNEVAALIFSDTAYLDENNSIYYFSGSSSFSVQNEKAVDSVISFKSACDILEAELAPNMQLKFEDVELWYEPRGALPSADNASAPENIKCVPKWYFISQNIVENDFHTIDYVTVDCQSGEIQVFVPSSR